MKKINFMLTAFRDGLQSVYGARVFSFDYLPCVEFAAKECGIRHFEAGGGAMFQSPFFYSNENSFDVMDAFRKATGPQAVLQTLSRGINICGLKAQPKEIIQLQSKVFHQHGVNTIRNYDALNDVRNLHGSGQSIRDAGLKHEVTITMMELPLGCDGSHALEFYEKKLRDILDSGLPFDSFCFKDASGSSHPQKVFETLRMARRLLGEKVKIAFHSHDTAGICMLAYKAAIEAGANQIDLSLAPVSGGASQPDVLTMWHALRGTDYSLDVNVDKIIELEEMFKDAMKSYLVPHEAVIVNPLIAFLPMPGGALTSNSQMFHDDDLMDWHADVIKGLGDVIKKGGLGTSVTPVSQFYFQQAYNNVMFGPWKRIAEGYGRMVLGYFGKTPGTPDPHVVKLAMEQLQLQPTKDHLQAIEDDPKRGIAAVKAALAAVDLPLTQENILIAATCGERGISFLKGQGKIGVRKRSQTKAVKPAPSRPVDTGAPSVCNIALNGRDYRVILDGDRAMVNGTLYEVAIKDQSGETPPAPMIQPAPAKAAPAKPSAKVSAAPEPNAPVVSTSPKGVGQPLSTQLPGLVVRIEKPVGSAVNKGDTVLVVESMKMDNAIVSSVNGTVVSIEVNVGDQVQPGQDLALIG